MNWDAVAAVGQTVSALALIFVIVQVRHARLEVRRSMSKTRAEGARELLMSKAISTELCGLSVKVVSAIGRGSGPVVGELVSRAGLTETEALRLYFEQEAWWQYRAQIIQYIDELAEGERVAFDVSIRQSYDGARFVDSLWYASRKDMLNPDAVRYIDNLLAQPG